MLKLSTVTLASSRFRMSLKYPSLVSYNKLPWEVVNHETCALHKHVAPRYEQVIALAATTPVPNLVHETHMAVSEAQRLQVLPGLLYLQAGGTLPDGFTSHAVADETALQYYGTLSHTIAPIKSVKLLTSDDLRLLCLAVTMDGTYLSVAPRSSLAQLGAGAADKASDNTFTLFHYFRPNRPVTELTRPLDRFYVHRPRLAMLDALERADGWEPKLQSPQRGGSGKEGKAAPMPAYRPPQSYLMGLAERLAVRPGSSFGRRSLMWGHWF